MLIRNGLIIHKTGTLNLDAAIQLKCTDDDTGANVPMNITLQGVVVSDWVGSNLQIIGTPGQTSLQTSFSPPTTAPDVTRSIASYAKTLAPPLTPDTLLAAALEQRRSNWKPALTANAINAYLRAGFA